MTKMLTQSYQRTELDSGIRVVTERIPYVRSVSIGAWVSVGSRDETEINNGISHYIEHMMFKGTATATAADIAQSLESVGGQINAFTGKELTCYYAHVLDEHLPRAIGVIADILSNSLFDEKEMDKERRVILDELNTIVETPEELIHDIFWDDLFPGHPLGYSIIGNKKTISAIDRQTLVDYVHENYTSNRLTISAAGNVDHDELVALVERHFIGISQGITGVYSPPRTPQNGRNVVPNGAIQAHLCVGTHAYTYRDSKKFALLILNTLLGAGMSSRLFQNIREKHGIAYSVYSFIDFMFDSGIFGVYLGTDSQNIDQSLALIGNELNDLRHSTISSDELERTKSQLKGSLMLGLESTASRMTRLAKMEIYLEKYYTLDQTLTEIDGVTAAQVFDVANELFDPSRLHTTILRPKNDVK